MKARQRSIYRIYALVHPLNGGVLYVGRTRKTLNERFSDHISGARLARGYPSEKQRYLQQMFAAGLLPKIVLLEETSDPNAERQWLQFFVIFRHELRNGAPIPGTSLFERR